MYQDSVVRDAYIEFATVQPEKKSTEMTLVEDTGNAKGFAKAERNLSNRKLGTRCRGKPNRRPAHDRSGPDREHPTWLN